MKNSFILVILLGLLLLSQSSAKIAIAEDNSTPEISFSLTTSVIKGDRTALEIAAIVKDELRLLGIDLKISEIGLDQLYNGTNFQQDLFIHSHDFNLPTPSLSKLYRTDSSYRFHYLSYGSDFSIWQSQDMGWEVSEIEEFMTDIEYSTNITEKKILSNRFAELFMFDLLYEYPLFLKTSPIYMKRGYGGISNELWNTNEGPFQSRRFGASWSSTEYINHSENSLYLPIRDVYSNFLDPLRIPHENTEILKILNTPLLNIDTNFTAHPGLAYQWVKYPINSQDGDIINRHQFFINANRSMQFTDGHPVDAKDIAMTLSMYDLAKNSSLNITPHWFNRIIDWNISSTVYDDDTLTIDLRNSTLNDHVYLGNMVATPAHLFNEYLKLQKNDTITEPSYFLSEVYENWLTSSNQTLVGPYYLKQWDKSNNSITFEERSDFTFPNEYDTNYMISKYSSNFSNLPMKMTTFAPHQDQTITPYYWTYADNPETEIQEKPETQGIDNIVYRILPEGDIQFEAFSSGQIDYISTNHFGINTSTSVSRSPSQQSRPYSLVFNLENEYLKKRDIRYAIASGLNKKQMMENISEKLTSLDSPISMLYDNVSLDFNSNGDLHWYNPYPIRYDFELARDLMRADGYYQYPEPIPHEDPIQATTADPLIINPTGQIIGLAVIAIFIKKYKR